MIMFANHYHRLYDANVATKWRNSSCWVSAEPKLVDELGFNPDRYHLNEHMA